MHNTGNNVPSTSPKDIADNAEVFDQLLNSDLGSVAGRKGKNLKPWPVMQAGIDNIIASLDTANFTFPDISSGLSGTVDGQYFRVPQADVNLEYAFLYYRNDAGLAVLVASLISNQYVDARLVPGNYIPSFFPILQDVNGAVPLWLDEGKIDAAGFGPQLKGGIAGIPNEWAQTYLRQLDLDPSFFPLIFDKNDNVILWSDGSRPDAAGLGPVLQQYILDLVGGGIESPLSSYIEGDKYKFTFKRGRVFSNAATSLNIAFTGDSWTEKNTIPQSMINLLGGTYKDPGWISCSTRTDGVMSGIALAVSGFTKYDGDNENNNSAPQYGSGPDGNAYYNNNTVGTLTWSNVKATDLSLYYYDGTGSFTITIDGGSPVTITGGGTSVTKKYDISGLSSSSHTVVITSSGAGIVSIFGMYGKNSGIASGITISRMGNGGAMAKDFLNWRSWISPVVSTLDIDLLFVILGTNDFRKSAGVDEYKNGIQAIIDAYKAATPGICICLVSPGQCSATGIPSLLEYDKAMRDIATDNEVNFISGYQLFPKTYDNSNGAWADTLHLSSLGAYVLTRKIKDEFMKD